jgi:hypothetical protein
MAIITDAFVAALKKVKVDADNLSEQELAQLTEAVNSKVAEANAALTAEVGDLKADLQKIADALVDPTLPPVETAEAVAEVLTEGDGVEGTVTPAFPS